MTDCCTGCGTCVSVCKHDIIFLVETKGYYTAKIDRDKCNVKIYYIKLSRKLIYKSLRLSSKGSIYFANN